MTDDVRVIFYSSIVGFELTCSAVGRPLTITCEANDVIDTSLCAYEENDPPSGTMGESCKAKPLQLKS